MLKMILQTLAAGLGTLSFCVLFRAPKKYFAACGFVGSIEWVVYLLVNHFFDNGTAATFCAGLTIIILSRYFSVAKKCPMTMFLIPGIFPLVPGTAIYHMTYCAANGNYVVAFSYCMQAIQAAFAIAIAFAIGYRMPARWFTVLNFSKKRKENN